MTDFAVTQKLSDKIPLKTGYEKNSKDACATYQFFFNMITSTLNLNEYSCSDKTNNLIIM